MAINTQGLSARNVQTIIESAINTKKLEHPFYGFLEFCLRHMDVLPFSVDPRSSVALETLRDYPADEARLRLAGKLLVFNDYQNSCDKFLINRPMDAEHGNMRLAFMAFCMWKAVTFPNTAIHWMTAEQDNPDHHLVRIMKKFPEFNSNDYPESPEIGAVAKMTFNNKSSITIGPGRNYEITSFADERKDVVIMDNMHEWKINNDNLIKAVLADANQVIADGWLDAEANVNTFRLLRRHKIGPVWECVQEPELEEHEDLVNDVLREFTAIGENMLLDDVLAAVKDDSPLTDALTDYERDVAVDTAGNLPAMEQQVADYVRKLQATPVSDELQAKIRQLPDYENMDAKQKSGLAYDLAVKFNLTQALQQELAAIPALSPDEYAAYRVTKLWKGACQDLYVLKGVDTEKDAVFALKYRDVLAALLDMWVAGNYDLMEFFAKHIKDAEQQLDDAEPGTGFTEVVELAAIRKATRDAQREFSADWVLDGKYEKSYNDFLAEWEAWGRDQQVEFLQGKGLYVLRKRAGVKRMVDELTEMQKRD